MHFKEKYFLFVKKNRGMKIMDFLFIGFGTLETSENGFDVFFMLCKKRNQNVDRMLI
jgi:hypothetical protein